MFTLCISLHPNGMVKVVLFSSRTANEVEERLGHCVILACLQSANSNKERERETGKKNKKRREYDRAYKLRAYT